MLLRMVVASARCFDIRSKPFNMERRGMMITLRWPFYAQRLIVFFVAAELVLSCRKQQTCVCRSVHQGSVFALVRKGVLGS